ncbi:MAG: prephenate dehydrogenase [Ruminococcaceae bacterium]|nr:prephenate dehydrogenase [Oscillospiraceae bacterium]
MKLNKNADTKILIVGLGLLGGSYARALKKKGYTVWAIEKKNASVEYALKEGIIDRGSTLVEEGFIKEADITVFALYPHIFLDWVREHGAKFPRGAFLTDVTGVKSCIVERVQELLPEGVEYIAAHPMAGKEVGGVENSDDSIFRSANYIVVPTSKNTHEGVELCRELGKELGFASISVLTPAKHDEMIAFLSQLTHCIAVSLMCAGDDTGLVDYTGDSFRDLTRIAKIQEDMWSELFLLNKQALLEQMDKFEKAFDMLRDAVAREDTEKMKEMMRLSTARRALFDKKEKKQ